MAFEATVRSLLNSQSALKFQCFDVRSLQRVDGVVVFGWAKGLCAPRNRRRRDKVHR